MNSGIDLAIRVGSSKDASLKQRRVGSFRDVLCGNRQVVESGKRSNSGYIANHWQEKEISHNLENRNSGGTHRYEARTICRVDSFHTCLTLIQSGAGAGIIPDFVVSSKNSPLQPVFPDYQLSQNPVYALHPFQQQIPINVQVCLEAVEKQLLQVTRQPKHLMQKLAGATKY